MSNLLVAERAEKKKLQKEKLQEEKDAKAGLLLDCACCFTPFRGQAMGKFSFAFRRGCLVYQEAPEQSNAAKVTFSAKSVR